MMLRLPPKPAPDTPPSPRPPHRLKPAVKPEPRQVAAVTVMQRWLDLNA